MTYPQTARQPDRYTHTHLDGQLISFGVSCVVEDPKRDHRWQRDVLWGAGGHAEPRPGPVVLGGVPGLGARQDLHLIFLARVEVSDLKLVEICRHLKAGVKSEGWWDVWVVRSGSVWV